MVLENCLVVWGKPHHTLELVAKIVSTFFILPQGCLLVFLEKEKVGWGGGERNIDQLPPVCVLTRNQTHNLFLVYGMILQATEPPGQD